MKKIVILLLSIIFVCMLIPYGCNAQSKYFNFLKSRSAKLDEKASKLEIVVLEESKYILTRDTTGNGVISFIYTPLEDVTKSWKKLTLKLRL